MPMTFYEKTQVMHDYAINLDKGIIFLAGELDGSLGIVLRIKYHCIKEYWEQEKKEILKEIDLVFNSFGGDANTITSVLDFFDELKKEGVVVNAQAEGVCMSAATFIIAGAPGKRTANKRARFMVHELQLSNIEGTQTQVKSFQEETNRLQRECYQLYAELSFSKKGTKPTKKQISEAAREWESLCEKEYYFGAEEALKRGIIDFII